MATAYIGLGSNLGDRAAQLDFAIAQLRTHPAIEALRCSAYYETAPVGPVQQGDFLNAVAEIETTLSPDELLELGQHIEREAGRTREIRWGPRTLDLDLLDYDQRSILSEKLTLPHPEAAKRAFVLVPWAELAPDCPLAGKTVSDWLGELDSSDIRPLKRAD